MASKQPVHSCGDMVQLSNQAAYHSYVLLCHRHSSVSAHYVFCGCAVLTWLPCPSMFLPAEGDPPD